MVIPLIGAAASIISSIASSRVNSPEDRINQRIDRLTKQLDNMPQTAESRAVIVHEINSLKEERDAMGE